MARQYPRKYPSRKAYVAKQGASPQWLFLQRQTTNRAKKQAAALMSLGMMTNGLAMISTLNSHMNATMGTQHDAFRTILARIDSIVQKDRAGMDPYNTKRVNTEIATAAQRSLIAGYAGRKPQRDLPSYREGATRSRGPNAKRFANGALLRAIGSPAFFKVTATSIHFINAELLGKEAKHWRRLNFGTQGGAALTPPARFDVRWGDLLVGSMGLTPDVRPAFRLPPGVWVQPGIFYPMGEIRDVQNRGDIYAKEGGRGPAQSEALIRRRGRNAPYGPPSPPVAGQVWNKRNSRMTKGIASTNFLDAGVKRLASETGLRYQGLVDEWLYDGLPQQYRKLSVRKRYSTTSADYPHELQAKVRKQQRYLSDFNKQNREMIAKAKGDARRVGAKGYTVFSRTLG